MAISDLYNSENFKKFIANVKAMRDDSMAELKTGIDSSMIFRSQGAVTVLDAVLTLPEEMDAEEQALKEENDEGVEQPDYL